MSENILFKDGDILLTDTKLQAGGNTYFLKNIGGVSVVKKSNIIIWFLYFLGAVSVFNSLGGQGWWYLPIGIAMIFGGVKLKNLFCTLLLDTNTGRVKAINGNIKVLLDIKAKIEQAIEANLS